MTDNPHSGESDDLDLVQTYRNVVLEYEALDEEIDTLLAEHGGATENMSEAEFAHYRTLARRRDDVYNQMKALEQQLMDDDNA